MAARAQTVKKRQQITHLGKRERQSKAARPRIGFPHWKRVQIANAQREYEQELKAIIATVREVYLTDEGERVHAHVEFYDREPLHFRIDREEFEEERSAPEKVLDALAPSDFEELIALEICNTLAWLEPEQAGSIAGELVRQDVELATKQCPHCARGTFDEEQSERGQRC